MKKNSLRKGMLIAIEGIDGAGKTTQAMMLNDHFEKEGYEVIYLKEPTKGQYGRQIKHLAKNGRHLKTPEEELELFIHDRIEDCKYNIRPALERKELIFMDRYYFSTIAYQGALGLDTSMILRRNEEIAVIPDLVLILDVAVNIGLSRISEYRKDKPDHFEKKDYLEKVREIFKSIKKPYIQLIDGTREKNVVFNHVRNIVKDIIAPFALPIKDQTDLFLINAENIYISKN